LKFKSKTQLPEVAYLVKLVLLDSLRPLVCMEITSHSPCWSTESTEIEYCCNIDASWGYFRRLSGKLSLQQNMSLFLESDSFSYSSAAVNAVLLYNIPKKFGWTAGESAEPQAVSEGRQGKSRTSASE
jgi:hypothetical protein